MIDIRDCYMRSYLSSLVLSSSFTDLVLRKRENWSSLEKINFVVWFCYYLGLRIVDIKLGEIFRTIWCVLAFSTIQKLRDFLSFQTERQEKSQTCDNLGIF